MNCKDTPIYINTFNILFNTLNIDTSNLKIILCSYQFDDAYNKYSYSAIVRKISLNEYVINIDEFMSKIDKIKAFIHELVHISQIQSNRLKIFKCVVWYEGLTYTDKIPYEQLPYEMDAINKTKLLYSKYKKQLQLN